MSELNSIKSRTYSRLGQRGSIFGMSVLDVAKEDDKLVVLTADLATLSGLTRFSEAYPDRFFNVGIAEQNMLGIAAGLSAEGCHPVVTTYATFISLRSCEQIRHYLGYMGLNVIVIGSGAGLIQAYSGNTHYSVEDISVMRTIPNITVLSPADAGEAVKAFEAACKCDGPVYIRLTAALNCPIIYKEDFEFKIGKGVKLREGDDVAIVATGSMVSKALKVAEAMSERGVECAVIDMHTIKPLDTDILKGCFGAKLMVTIEEHSVIGGLGGAVSEFLSGEINSPVLHRFGIMDTFLKPADYEHLLGQCGLTAPQLTDKIIELYDSINK